MLSIKAHLRRALFFFFFFSFNADGQMVFRARLAAERTGPADTKGVDVICCRRNAELGEFLS